MPQGGQPQQMQAPPAPDPVMQAVIDASFRPVDLQLSAEQMIACKPHGLESCAECDVDFASTNRIARVLLANPNLLCPPPAKVVNAQIGQFIAQTKEEGNVCYLCS